MLKGEKEITASEFHNLKKKIINFIITFLQSVNTQKCIEIALSSFVGPELYTHKS